MNFLKRTIALPLVLCFVLTALVACGKKTENGDTEESDNDASQNQATEKQTTIYGEPTCEGIVPTEDLDFEGEELTVLLRNNEVTVREWYKESTEDELDEAVAMRNAAVEETLNLNINYEIINYGDFNSGTATFNGMIAEDVISDMHYYDIAVHWALAGGYASIRDYNANVLDDNQFPYFDFSLPCWNQSVVNGTVVNDRLHLFCGDVNISQFDYAVVMWYNKTLYDEKREDTDHENIQELALDGLWTYDELYMWANRLYEDSNGTAGKQADDTYGFATRAPNINTQPIPKDALAAAFDVEILITNPDGTHSYNIIGNDKAEKVRDMWIKIFEVSGTWGDGGSTANFASGKYLFWSAEMYPGKQDNMTIREMDDKYGLLPMPKYNSDQEQYYTASYDGYSLMSVLDHAKSTVQTKGEAISAFLQLATEESYTSVRGYYFNRIVKPKYFGTDDSEGTVSNSIALFDIIIANITFEFWTIYSNQLGNLTWAWRDSMLASRNSLEAQYLAKQAEFDKSLREMDAWFGLITLEDEE
jgi:hypothetical protein